MTITSATEVPALQQQRRAPMYFPGNEEDQMPAEPPPSGDFSFADLLDVINPLQHIPVISSIYRAITGDTISPTANVMGSALFGGPVGVFAAAATEMFSEMTGGSPEEHLLAMVGGGPTGNAAAPDPQPAVGASPAPAALLAEAEPQRAASASPAPAALPAEAKPPSPAAPPAGEAPAPSALFQALQMPGGGTARGGEQQIAAKTGRDIRSYFADAVHVRPEAASRRQLQVPAEEAERSLAVGGTSDAGQDRKPEAHTGRAEEREAMRAAVAAAHARGIEMLRQQGWTQSAAPVQDAPDWFAERMMEGLAKYRDGSQLGGQPASGTAISG